MSAAPARRPEADVDSQFVERWSPRAFSSRPVPAPLLSSLFEAARWAPSCANHQPWLFVYASSDADLARFRPLLDDGNRRWTDTVPVLAFLFAKRASRRGPNRWAPFDAGAAWMSLALQGMKVGLRTHAMAGFHEDKVYEVLGVPREDYEVMAAIAIGHAGSVEDLVPALREREAPSPRKPLSEVAHEGRFRLLPPPG